jgi:hypothetical protein
MLEEVITSIAEDVKAPVDKKPMSEKDFLSSRIAKRQPQADPTPEKVEAKPEVAVEAEPEAKAKAPAPDVLSKDLEDMSEAELADLAKKLGSKAVARYGELTFKRKQAEEQIEQLKAELARREQQSAPAPVKVENNPYAHLDSIDKVDAEERTISDLIEFAEDALFKADDMSAYDVAAKLDGKEYTKAEVREILLNARKAKSKYIPAQRQELTARTQREAVEGALRQKARKELPWMEGEDNDTRKHFEAIRVDPRFKKLKDAVPDLAPQFEYLMAHAANSMYGRRAIVEDAPSKTTLKPPSSPKVSAAAPERSDSRNEEATREIMDRFRKSGRPDDFVALRTAQISKRKAA